jgi:hypothetical protein
MTYNVYIVMFVTDGMNEYMIYAETNTASQTGDIHFIRAHSNDLYRESIRQVSRPDLNITFVGTSSAAKYDEFGEIVEDMAYRGLAHTGRVCANWTREAIDIMIELGILDPNGLEN